MSSITSSLLTLIGFKSTSKRATPRLISTVVDNLSQPSIHDRSSYSAPALRSPQSAFNSPLFLDHPSRFVSLSELIPGLAPPSEVQLADLESIEAEGEIIGIESKQEDELTKRLLKSLAHVHLPTPAVGPAPSQVSLFVSSLFEPKSRKPIVPNWTLSKEERLYLVRWNISEQTYLAGPLSDNIQRFLQSRKCDEKLAWF